MALLPILSFPDPRLRTIAQPVEEVTDEIRQLAADTCMKRQALDLPRHKLIVIFS